MTDVDIPVMTIRPPKGRTSLGLAEVWQFRELLYFLVWRDVKVRYKQTALGAAWAILQPLSIMLVFSVFFGRLAKVPSEGLPYPLFVYTALLPWHVFAHGLGETSNSLVANARLITKVYFPRLVVPLATVLTGVLDFGVAFVAILAMVVYYQVALTWRIVTLPFFALLAVFAALGVGLWLSALNVRYRDVRYTLPFVTQVWLLATPVAYPSSLVPEPWRLLYGMNPMTGVVDGFRWALFGTSSGPGWPVVVSLLTIAVVLITGLQYFRRTERHFADIV